MSKIEALLQIQSRRSEMLERLYIDMIRQRNTWKIVASELANSYLKSLEESGQDPDNDPAIQNYMNIIKAGSA